MDTIWAKKITTEPWREQFDVTAIKQNGELHRPPHPRPSPLAAPFSLWLLQPDMAIPTESAIAKTRDRLTLSGSDKSSWGTSFWFQIKVLLERESKQSRGEVSSKQSRGDI